MINKENILFSIVGLLLGLIVGFFFANSVNQSATVGSPTAAVAGMPSTAGLPGGHPPVPGAAGGSAPEIQAAIDAAKQNPNDFDAQIKAAQLYYQIQRFEGAIEFLKRANELQPDNYEVMVHVGDANFDANKYEEAEKWYTDALAKKPEDNDVRTDLGLTFIFREKPDYDRAIKEFKRVLETNPSHTQAMQNLAVAYTKKGSAADAKGMLAQLEGIDPTNSALPKLKEELKKLETK